MFSIGQIKTIIDNFGIFTKGGIVEISLIGNDDVLYSNFIVASDPGHSHEIRICANINSYINIYKKNGIKKEEKKFIENFVDRINEIIACELPELYIHDVCTKIQIESIVNTLIGDDHQNLKEKIISTIDMFDKWSKETYETQNICASVGFDPFCEIPSDIDVTSLIQDDMMKVMSNGIDTMFLCNADGKLVTLQYLEESPTYVENIPSIFSKIAQWAQVGKIALTLTQRGEILIFTSEGLSYARRRGGWIFINCKQNSHVMGHDTAGFFTPVRRAVLDTCLDVSFRRTGTCIGIIKEGGGCPECVQSEDVLADSQTDRANFLRKVITGKKFHEVSRTIRQELAAIDGALVLSGDGTVLAIGAILKIEGVVIGRTTGGRSVAAQTLARYGYGIKVSADGQIQAWGKQGNTQTVTSLFTMA